MNPVAVLIGYFAVVVYHRDRVNVGVHNRADGKLSVLHHIVFEDRFGIDCDIIFAVFALGVQILPACDRVMIGFNIRRTRNRLVSLALDRS